MFHVFAADGRAIPQITITMSSWYKPFSNGWLIIVIPALHFFCQDLIFPSFLIVDCLESSHGLSRSPWCRIGHRCNRRSRISLAPLQWNCCSFIWRNLFSMLLSPFEMLDIRRVLRLPSSTWLASSIRSLWTMSPPSDVARMTMCSLSMPLRLQQAPLDDEGWLGCQSSRRWWVGFLKHQEVHLCRRLNFVSFLFISEQYIANYHYHALFWKCPINQLVYWIERGLLKTAHGS